jgi:uncharacterized protein (TIGR04141 family)
MAESSIGFTVFLLKSDQVAEFQAKFPATSGVGLSGGIVGYFIPMPSEGAVPQWAVAVTALLQTVAPPDLQSQRPSALLVIERGARTYVLTFGHAWQLLEDDWLEPDFGRRVALNLITKGSLIEIRTEQVFANWHVASDRSPRAASVEEFGVEFDRDLVAVVEGLSSKKEFGKTVRGGTSLRLNIPISTLVAVLGQCEGLFLSNEYRNTWPEIDNPKSHDTGLLRAGGSDAVCPPAGLPVTRWPAVQHGKGCSCVFDPAAWTGGGRGWDCAHPRCETSADCFS